MRVFAKTADGTKAAVLKRLSRIEGQVRDLARMVEEDGYYIDIVTQISAAWAALRRGAGEVLHEHLSHCVEHAIASCPLAEVDDFTNVAGKGVRGKVGNANFLLGSPRFISESGVSLAAEVDRIEELEDAAKTVMVVARDGILVGVLAVADAPKKDAKTAVDRLRSEGIDTVMITGDNRKTAAAIARQAGIDRVFADVLPQDKAQQIRSLQKNCKRVAFVGDGINDAPALAQADLGIAMGTGTDIAIEAGNIVLVKGDPTKVIEALTLARLTFKTIKQNMFWAFFYNVAAIPLAAFGLLNPMIAAGAIAISSVSVVGNSLRIRRARLS